MDFRPLPLFEEFIRRSAEGNPYVRISQDQFECCEVADHATLSDLESEPSKISFGSFLTSGTYELVEMDGSYVLLKRNDNVQFVIRRYDWEEQHYDLVYAEKRPDFLGIIRAE